MAAGPSAAVSEAFGVELRRFRLGSTVFRGRVGPVLLPAALAEVIEGVFGLDDRPQASAHFRIFDVPGRSPVPVGRPARPTAARARATARPRSRGSTTS